MKRQILNAILSWVISCSCMGFSGEPVNSEVNYYYDVPLDIELQRHIDNLCQSEGIDTALVLAVIEQESNYNCHAVGDGERSKGLMQIQQQWHEGRMQRLGVEDLMDPYQNIEVGVDILSDLLEKEKGTEWALMAYNGGEALANKNSSMGITNEYAQSVMNFKHEIEAGTPQTARFSGV